MTHPTDKSVCRVIDMKHLRQLENQSVFILAKAYKPFDWIASRAWTSVSDRIAKKAYEFFEQRGRQDGQDLDDWLQAKRL